MKIVFYVLVAVVILFGGYLFLGNSGPSVPLVNPADNVTLQDGKQIIMIRAKGGYQPRVSQVKAGIPTVVRFETNGTFDCSSSVRIPSMDISAILPASGQKEIALGMLQPGTIDGTCGMGMYPFEIQVVN